MLAFDEFCRRTNALARLESLSVTTPTNFASGLEIWCSKVAALVAPAPLRRFQVYSGSEAHTQALPDSFCAAIAYAHRATLTRFSVHRISVSLEAIKLVCRFCTQLEQLFVTVEKRALVRGLRPPRTTRVMLTGTCGAERAGRESRACSTAAYGACQLCKRHHGRRRVWLQTLAAYRSAYFAPGRSDDQPVRMQHTSVAGTLALPFSVGAY